MASVELFQNRGFITGKSSPFIDSPAGVAPEGLQVASAWSFECHGDVLIRCIREGSIFLSGDPSLEFELKVKRVAYGKERGLFTVKVKSGEELRIVSRVAVFAEEIRIVSPVEDSILWCVVTCMGRLDHVKRTAPRLIAQKNCRYVLVDWSCPDKCGDWIESNFPQAIVLRSPGHKLFHLRGARNLGVSVVPSGAWVCFIDCDVIAHDTFCERMLSKCERGAFVWPKTNKHTYGTFAINKDDLDAVGGGYDELIDTWGNEDGALYSLFKIMGIRRIHPKPFPLMNHIDHDDRRRVCYSRIKDRNKSARSTELYVHVRNQRTRQLGRLLTLSERRELYDRLALR
jgi:hypothetical protein